MQPEASCGPSRRYCGPAPPFDTATGQFGEAAWSYRFPARLSRELLLRQENQPRSIRDIAWKGQVRLCARYRRLTRVAKPANVVTTAMLDYSASWRSAGPARPRGRRRVPAGVRDDQSTTVVGSERNETRD